jgi:hypothetical protein
MLLAFLAPFSKILFSQCELDNNCDSAAYTTCTPLARQEKRPQIDLKTHSHLTMSPTCRSTTWGSVKRDREVPLNEIKNRLEYERTRARQLTSLNANDAWEDMLG